MNHRSRITSILASLLIWACGDAGEYVYGDTLEQVELTTNDQSIGVYPNTTVMDDPNNPSDSIVPEPRQNGILRARAIPSRAL